MSTSGSRGSGGGMFSMNPIPAIPNGMYLDAQGNLRPIPRRTPTPAPAPRAPVSSSVARRLAELEAEERAARAQRERATARAREYEESFIGRTLGSIARFTGSTPLSETLSGQLAENERETRERIQRERAFIEREGRVAAPLTFGQRVTGGLASIPRGGIEGAAQLFGAAGILGGAGEDFARRTEARGQRLAENLGLGRSETAEFDPTQRGIESFGQGLGSILPYVASEVVGRRLAPVTRAAMPVARGAQALLGTGQGASEARQRMDEYEQRTGERLDPNTRRWVQAGGASIGLTELLPIGRMVSSLPAPVRTAVNDRISNIVAQTTAGRLTTEAAREAIGRTVDSIERNAIGRIATRGFAPEALQEGGAQLAQNVLSRAAYDEEQALMEGVGESALLGGFVGGTVRGGVEVTRALGRRAAANRQKELEMRAAQELESGNPTFNLLVPNPNDPTQPIPETVTAIRDVDAEGRIAFRRPDGTIFRATEEEIQSMLAPEEGTGAAPIPETFSRPVIAQRLTGALGENATIDDATATYIGGVNKQLTNAMVSRNPEQAANYLTKQQDSLRRAKLPEETKIARMLVLDEAQRINTEFTDFLTAPPAAPEGAPEGAPAEQPAPAAPTRDVAAEIAQAQEDARAERAKRNELLQQTLDSPDINKFEVFNNLMATNGFAPNAIETATIRDFMRQQSDLETTVASVNDMRDRELEVARMNIIEPTLYNPAIKGENRVRKMNADLKRRGLEPLTRDEMQRVYGYEAAEAVFGPGGEKRDRAFQRIANNPTIKDKYRAFVGLVDKNGWEGPSEQEVAILRGDAAEIESLIPTPEERLALRETPPALTKAPVAKPRAPVEAPAVEAPVAEAPVAEAPVAEAPAPVEAPAVPARGEPPASLRARVSERYSQYLAQREAGGPAVEAATDPAAVEALITEVRDAAEIGLIPKRTAEVTEQKLRDGSLDLGTARARFDLMVDKATDTGVRYRGEGSREGGMTADEVQSIVDEVIGDFEGAPNITVVNSIDDLPPTLQVALRRDNAERAKGFVDNSGTVYILANNAESRDDIAATVYHETLGHLGLASLFRTRLDAVLQQMYNTNPALKREANAWLKANPDTYRGDDRKVRAVEEILAGRSEGGRVKASIWSKLGAMMKDFARRMGLNLKMTDGEVKAILAMAHDQIVNGTRESVVIKGLRYLPAFHGSPHDFDKFSTRAMGSGEGAQVFGWGMYFSSSKSVAKWYRDNLTQPQLIIDTPNGVQSERTYNAAALVDRMGFPEIQRGVQTGRYPATWALDRLGHGNTDLDAVIKEMRESAYSHFPKEILDDAEAKLRAANPRIEEGGKLYEVELAPKEDELLDWNKPLSEQSQHVQHALREIGISGETDVSALEAEWHALNNEYDRVYAERSDLLSKMGAPHISRLTRQELDALAARDPTGKLRELSDTLQKLHAETRAINRRIYTTDPTGKEVYETLEATLGSPQAASQALLLAGIRGNTYKGDSSGVRNYVIFGDSDVSITNKYRLLPRALPGGPPPSPNRPLIDTLGFATDMQGRMNRIKSRIIRKINDRYRGATDYTRALAAVYGVTELPDNMNVANKFALLESRKGGNQMALKRWHLDPIEEKVKELKLDPQDVGLYLWARSAKDRNAMVRKRSDGEVLDGSGMTDADADDIMKQLVLEGIMPEIKQVAKLFDNMIDYIGNKRVEAGLLSKEDWVRIRKEQPFYAPLKGAALDGEDMNEDGDPKLALAEAREEYTRGGGRTQIKEFLSAKGRKGMPFNPLLNGMTDAQYSIARMERNRVGVQLLDNVLSDPATHESVVKAYSEKKTPGATMLSGEALTAIRRRATEVGRAADKVFIVKKDGQTFYLDFQNSDAGNALYRAFSNMTPAELGTFMRGATTISNGLKSLMTRWSPSYLLGTAWQRDFQEAILTNFAAQGIKGGPAEGKKIAARSAAYMFSPEQAAAMRAYIMGKDPSESKLARLRAAAPGSTMEGVEDLTVLFDQFLRDGGAPAHAVIADTADRVQSFNNALGVIAQMQKGRPDKAALEAAGLGLDFLDTVSQVIDMQARFATYRAALDADISRENAAMLALDSSLNLTRRGEWAPYMDAIFFFASASIEGGRKFIKQGLSSRNAALAITASFKLGMLAQILHVFLGGDDDEDGRSNIYDVNDITRQTRLVLYHGLGTNDYVQIPMAFSFGFSKYAGEQFAAALLGDITPMEAGVTIANAFKNMASPVKLSLTDDYLVDALNTLSPIAPFVQAEGNVNFFGSPVYRENKFSEEPRSEMGREDTPEIWKTIARGLNYMTDGSTYQSGGFSRQPEYFEHLASGYGGGLFRFMEEAAQGKMPDLLRLTGRGGEYAPMNNFYRNTERMGEALKLYNNDKLDDEQWEAAWAAESRRYPLVYDEGLLEAYDIAEQELRNIRQAFRNGEYESIEERNAESNEVYKAFNRLYNETKREQQGR